MSFLTRVFISEVFRANMSFSEVRASYISESSIHFLVSLQDAQVFVIRFS